MSITVNNIDQNRLIQKLEKSNCELCQQALDCIKSYERVLKMNQETNRKAISKIKKLSSRLRNVEDKQTRIGGDKGYYERD